MSRPFSSFVVKAANSEADLQNEDQVGALYDAWVEAERRTTTVASHWQERGYLLGDFELSALRERMLAYGRQDASHERTRLYNALRTDKVGIVDAFIADRTRQFGGGSNVTVEARARTGKAKSTVLLGIMERHMGLTPDHVKDCVHMHKPPFIRAVGNLNRRRSAGENVPTAVFLDEDDKASGIGSRTDEETLRRFEGRLRQTGMSMLFAKPNYIGDYTRDVTLELLGTSVQERKALCIVHEGEEPLGYDLLPWCSTPVYEAYLPTKNWGLEVVERGLSPQIPVLNSTLLELLGDEAVMERLSDFGWRSSAIKREVLRSPAGQWAGSMTDQLVQELIAIGPKWEDREATEDYAQEIQAILETGTAW